MLNIESFPPEWCIMLEIHHSGQKPSIYLRDSSAQTVSLVAILLQKQQSDFFFHLTKSQDTNSRPTTPRTAPSTPDTYQGCYWSHSFKTLAWLGPAEVGKQATNCSLVKLLSSRSTHKEIESTWLIFNRNNVNIALLAVEAHWIKN